VDVTRGVLGPSDESNEIPSDTKLGATSEYDDLLNEAVPAEGGGSILSSRQSSPASIYKTYLTQGQICFE
jgi:hypothetical protein